MFLTLGFYNYQIFIRVTVNLEGGLFFSLRISVVFVISPVIRSEILFCYSVLFPSKTIKIPNG